MFIPESCLSEFIGSKAIVSDKKPWEKTIDSFCLGQLTRIVAVDRADESADYLVTPLGLSEEDAWVYRVPPQWLVVLDSAELELADRIIAADSRADIITLSQNPLTIELLGILHYSCHKKFDDVFHPKAKVAAKPAKKSQYRR
jgi:hypothetical protein